MPQPPVVKVEVTDDDIEAELRSRTHADADWLQQSALALFLAQHLATPLAAASKPRMQLYCCTAPTAPAARVALLTAAPSPRPP